MNKQDNHKSDDELILSFRQTGDNRWLGLLLERHTLLLLGIAMKYLKDKHAAEDAVQQVFIKTITAFPKEPIQNFKGWLYILMRNHCFGVLRSPERFITDDGLEYVPSPENNSPEDWKLREQQWEHMHTALQLLNPEQQTCIRMFYMEERSYKEIMERTNFSFEQVKSYVQNGKRNLKILMQKMEQSRS
ncbi:sigma-70 family RNA polymerase sigma factor [Rurimicrobium arvi]|uniref:Sigma-70 family RNA polymerase sigma factor n=1 Tax=Rurimicrobium arvi TaxID=2049916 RepID=A0ABP8MHV8_9BACT